jgi:ADP-ribose pyrophosphatase YjhB (NUDIX family)
MGQAFPVKIRVAVVLPIDGGLLLARQNHNPFWVFPGGTLEPNETLEDCAIREMKEETNLEITVERLLHVTDWLRPGKHVIDTFFLGRHVGGNLRMTQEENLNGLQVFTLTELKSLIVQPQPAAGLILKQFENNFETCEPVYLGPSPL